MLPPPPGTPRRTDRTRIVQDWLARRETPDFHIAELRTHLELLGHRFGNGYLPALLGRWTRAGVVTKVGHGRYRVNGDRVELVL